jgi:hypothetical protein
MKDEKRDYRPKRFLNLLYLGGDASLFPLRLFHLSMRSRAIISGGQA